MKHELPKAPIRTIFSGYKIGLGAEKYIGVSEKYLEMEGVQVKHTIMAVHRPFRGKSKGYMVIKSGSIPVKKYFQKGKRDETGVQVLPDHFLYYFQWLPHKKKAEKVVIRDRASVDRAEQTLINSLLVLQEKAPERLAQMKEQLRGKLPLRNAQRI